MMRSEDSSRRIKVGMNASRVVEDYDLYVTSTDFSQENLGGRNAEINRLITVYEEAKSK